MAFCKKAKDTIKKALSFIDDKLSISLNAAYKVTTLLKQLIESPAGSFILSLLPDIPGLSKLQLVAYIETAFADIGLLIECKGLTGSDKINCYIKALGSLPIEQRNAVLIKIKSLLTKRIDGRNLPGKMYDTAAQVNYLLENPIK